MKPQQTPFDYDVNALTRVMRGIDPRLVQLILEEAKDEWRNMERKLHEMQTKLAQYEDERGSVNNALITAQKHADDAMRQAQYKADAVMADAQRKAEQVELEQRSVIRELESEMERYSIMKHKFADDFRALLKGYLNDVDAKLPSISVPTPAAYGVPSSEGHETHSDL